jgi:hypothetical protein
MLKGICLAPAARPVLRMGVLPVLVLAAAGCGPNMGGIRGKVTYKGEPVPYGDVAFVASTGLVSSVRIREDGSYEVHDLPAGAVKIGVRAHQPPGMGIAAVVKDRLPLPKGGSSTAAPKYVKIPAKWGDPEKSGLGCTVSRGSDTEYLIELTD